MRLLSASLLFLLTGCADAFKGFELLESSRTGIYFSNDIRTDQKFNALNYEYIYNGGGVATSDINGDGWTDIFFTGNQVSSRLYLNRGGLKFDDITIPAGVQTQRWCTGVAIADVNDDGKKDIYISVAGHDVSTDEMENLLFINKGWGADGIPVFEEAAAAYGLNDPRYSTQAAFFDYDLDGDLDAYLLNNALEKFNRNKLRPKRIRGEASSNDRLYRNEGNRSFTDISKEAGILTEGYGLGVQVSDLNLDGWPDVYVANDFLSNDLVWVNNGDGTFTNRAADYLQHQTHNGMGTNIADFNNDALPDIAVLDMLPEDNYRQKMMIPYVNPDRFQMVRNLGYEDQYMRNTIQLHRGFSPSGHPQFSEIGNLTGMAATDWSWSVFWADFDNDGWKDTYITNGYRKDVTNLDYINYSSYNQIFGTPEAKKEKAAEDLDQIPDVQLSNYMFRNLGNLTFEPVTENWGLDHASFSNGAAYADLDNDGDLDLVVNNIDRAAFVFENNFNSADGGNNFIQIELEENAPDITKYNAKIYVYSGRQKQYQEFSPFCGYKSTMSDLIHFGLGDRVRVDSIVVWWPGNTKTVLTEVVANQRITVSYRGGTKPVTDFAHRFVEAASFITPADQTGIDFDHIDHRYSAFRSTRTVIQDLAKTGPALAVGDIDGDGLEDLYAGGNIGQAGVFFIQNNRETFAPRTLHFDSIYQDTDAAFLDVDGDGDLDLYVASGGMAFPKGSHRYQDRLYTNDGKGNFSYAPEALPAFPVSSSCVRPSDFDGDGDLDLFVGGRVMPGSYPEAPKSYLLRNEGGKFVDAGSAIPQNLGMVTDARWTDFNGDHQPDLLVVGEWMPITFLEQRHGKLTLVTPIIEGPYPKTNGWWMHVNGTDLDGDGDEDYLVGNLGLNSKLQAGQDQPIRLYAKDFDGNGDIDPVMSCYMKGIEYPLHERDMLIDQLPGIKRRFTSYAAYAEATFQQVFTPDELRDATVRSSHVLASVLVENRGNMHFVIHPLPKECQFSPILGSQFADLDQNGYTDIITAGNLYAMETTQVGSQDASFGNVILQEGPFEWAASSHLHAGGDVRIVKSLALSTGRRLLLMGTYGGKLKTHYLLSPWGQTPR